MQRLVSDMFTYSGVSASDIDLIDKGDRHNAKDSPIPR